MQQAGSLKKLEGYYQKSLTNVVKGLQENASKLETEILADQNKELQSAIKDVQ
ncbi:hypothetical protein [Citrobacter sp. S-77]|uniref:hypothetical protein n=1 Tax=Citrobacter sp. S-77 TaxID=1080067 RepID=UPI000A51031F|nr:hypothetical protein [Citrobacter sp. S-77]